MNEDRSAALIQRVRSYAGLKQAELARRAGVQRSVLNAYEKGRREPSAAARDRILRAAGFDIRLVRATPLDDERAAKILEQVIGLAEALPYRPRSTMRYPPFRQVVR